jgi:thiol-disulfide isomerase/thioredoxin
MGRFALLLATSALGAFAAAAWSGDAIPPTPTPRVAATEPLGVGGQLTDEVRVAPIAGGGDVPLASLGGDDGKPLVVLFWSVKCPVCKRYGPVLKALAKDYDGRARVALVFPNATETESDVKTWLDAETVTSVAALDPKLDAAARLAVVVTPTVLVFDTTGVLRYRGPIDDDRRARRRDTTELLRAALEATLAGKPVENPEPRAFGSSVRRAAPVRR